MPTLDWIGKRAVVNHHREVPFHLLKEVPELSVGDPDAGNLLVQGDNLLALKALLPYYAGKVKCIYIDPPYNTGNENWVYNDAVNSPEMRDWLGKVVGAEAEDLTRHDKWLCMMYPRLALLREFLRADGVLFVSIGEDEVGRLRLLLEEVFGVTNALGTLVWKRRSSSAMRGTPLSIDHEYILAFGKDVSRTTLYGLAKSVDGYPLVDSEGRHYASTDLTVGMSRDERPGQYYAIRNPHTGREYAPNPDRVWRFFPATMDDVIARGLIIWPDDTEGRMERPRFRTYFDPESSKPRPVSTWIESASINDRRLDSDEVEYGSQILTSGTTQEGSKLLAQLLGGRKFAYPKPLSLVRSLIRASTRDDDIVLDSFAGSGTTGHAVLAMNTEDGGRRKFIMVEMDATIATNVAAQRLRKVIDGYTPLTREAPEPVGGLGGGVKFCALAEPLFSDEGAIRSDVKAAELAAHVYFAETGQSVDVRAGQLPLIGEHAGEAVYLLYNGVLGDRRPEGGNVLTREVLDGLPTFDGPKIIYGEGCRLGAARLARERITFKQIPYQIKVR